jgi:hypothetical protein
MGRIPVTGKTTKRPNLKRLKPMKEPFMAIGDSALRNRNKEIIQKATPLFDQLNESWEKIESFFRAQGILQSCYISYDQFGDWPQPDQFNAYGEELLGIEKHKGKWRICFAQLDYGSGEISGWTPVTEGSTEIRILLLDHVGKLFEMLVESNEKFVPEIEQAVAKSHSVLKALGISE